MTSENLTVLKKGRRGWTAKTTIENKQNYDWQVTTYRPAESNDIICTVQGGLLRKETTYNVFQFAIHKDPHYLLSREAVRCTEQNVDRIHVAGLDKFNKWLEAWAKE